MKITCTACAAEYNVPGVLAAGRLVRCAKCGQQWAPVPAPPVEAVELPAPPPIPEPPPEPALPIAAVEPLAPPAVAAPRRLPLLLAWVGSLVVIVAALVAVALLREPIMRVWPPSQRVYAVLGLRWVASPDVHGPEVHGPDVHGPDVHGNVVK